MKHGFLDKKVFRPMFLSLLEPFRIFFRPAFSSSLDIGRNHWVLDTENVLNHVATCYLIYYILSNDYIHFLVKRVRSFVIILSFDYSSLLKVIAVDWMVENTKQSFDIVILLRFWTIVSKSRTDLTYSFFTPKVYRNHWTMWTYGSPISRTPNFQ